MGVPISTYRHPQPQGVPIRKAYASSKLCEFICPTQTIAGFNLNLCLLEAREGVHGGFKVRSQTVEVSGVQFLNKFDLGTIPE